MNSKDESFSFGEDYYKRSGEMITVYLHTYMKIVQTFIECLELEEGEALTLGDLGALDGYSSLNMVAQIIDLLKKKSNHVVPVNIIYEDLHCNNFNTLVKTLKGHQLLDKHNVFVSMCPVTFYNQCQPENTFHIIMCTFSAHLLSRSICYKNSLYKHPDATAEERKAAEKQAAADWITFLCHRAKEMKSGAMMMLTMPVEDHKNSHIHLESLWIVMTEVWRQMKAEELISEAERQYSWAHILTQIVRDWTEYIFLEALDQRPAPSKRKVIDTFYTRLVDKLKCEDRESKGWVNIICYLVIRKR